MKKSNTALAAYQRDESLPFWQNYVDTQSIIERFANLPDKAQAWLRYRDVSESCIGFPQAAMMHGHFEGGVLADHTFCWTFTPGRRGDTAIVVPLRNDFVA